MTVFIILTIIFWIPVITIILKNILWNLHLWQNKEYSLKKFWYHIRWDYEPTNRSTLLTSIKFIIFSLTSLVFRSPTVTVIGISLAYCVWITEIILFFQNLISKKFPPLNFKSKRALFILFLGVLGILAVIINISVPFALIERTAENAYQETDFLSWVVDEGFIYTDVYFYLGISTLFALLIDLSSPIITISLVMLTLPLTWIKKIIAVFKAKRKLKKLRKNLNIIAITGSTGKSTVKKLLQQVLKEKYKVVSTSINHTHVASLAQEISKNINKNTEIYIAEISAYSAKEMKEIRKMLNPDFSLITNIRFKNLELFKNKTELLRANKELLSENSINVLNADDADCIKLAKDFKNTLLYSSNPKLNLSELSTEWQKIKEIKKSKTEGNIKLIMNNEEKDLNLPLQLSHFLESLLATLSIAFKLGITEEETEKSLKNFKIPEIIPDEIKGDNKTLIINATNHYSLKNLKNAIQKAVEKKKGRIVLATTGLVKLGKYKKQVYKDLAEETKEEVDILITTDKDLYKISMKDNTNTENILINKNFNLLYELRTKIQAGDTMIIHGEISKELIESLRSKE